MLHSTRRRKRRKMAKKDNVLDIIRGISQAVSNSHDGALDQDGKPVTIGMKREEGDYVLDKRIMDGFDVYFSGNSLIVKYQSEIMLSDVHGGKFETEVEQSVADIVSWLKKEYKKVTGNALTLKKDGEIEILVQNISRVRSIVNATCKYTIGGLDAEPAFPDTPEDRLSDAIKDWIGFGKDKYPKTSKASNVSGKRDEEPRK